MSNRNSLPGQKMKALGEVRSKGWVFKEALGYSKSLLKFQDSADICV